MMTNYDLRWLPYIAPLGTFLLLTSVEAYLPGSGASGFSPWYPWFYAGKIAAVAVVAWLCRATWNDLKPWPGLRATVLAIGLGVLVIGLWVGLDGLYPTFSIQGGRVGFDPRTLPVPGRWAFLACRVCGLVLIVPLIEELFWRSFLMRWVIGPDFTTVPVGRVTLLAAGVTALGFALAHPEWLPALLTGLAWAWLLARTQSLAACLISHMTANLVLGLYVVATGSWKFL